MSNKPTHTTELSAKVLKGMAMVIKDLVETSAANNESLAISDKDGKVKIVPAKELLDTIQK